MSKQPKALELAAAIEQTPIRNEADRQAADLLRTQHELIGELVEALEMCSGWVTASAPSFVYDDARALLSRIKEQQ